MPAPLPPSAGAPRLWAVVPAAGVGQRMGAALPKQYLALAGRTVLEHSLSRLLECPRIVAVVAVLAVGDAWWDGLIWTGPRRPETALGGAERCHSVLAGLAALADRAAPADWVLVHDAARPCLRPADLEALIDTLIDDAVGGIL